MHRVAAVHHNQPWRGSANRRTSVADSPRPQRPVKRRAAACGRPHRDCDSPLRACFARRSIVAERLLPEGPGTLRPKTPRVRRLAFAAERRMWRTGWWAQHRWLLWLPSKLKRVVPRGRKRRLLFHAPGTAVHGHGWRSIMRSRGRRGRFGISVVWYSWQKRISDCFCIRRAGVIN